MAAVQHRLFRNNIINTDGTLKYHENISLRNIALRSIVKTLWMNEKGRFVKGYHARLAFGENDGWRDIEDSVLTKVKRLLLPKTLITQLINLVEFVGNEIRNWIYFHVYNVFKAGKNAGCTSNEYDLTCLFIYYMDYVKWAHNGRIDVKKTATVLVSKTELEIEQKYVISCIYCLEDELSKVPTEVLNKYLQSFVDGKSDIDDFPMICYWTYHLKNRPRSLHYLIEDYHMPVEEYVLEEISDLFAEYYDVATEYLWKLTDDKKYENFLTVMKSGVSNFKFSLISAFEYEQQKLFFQSKFAVGFLMAMFCDWNFVDCFLPTIYHVSDILNADQYVSLFKRLSLEIDCLEKGDKFCKVECYKFIFEAVWENIPVHFQEYVYQNGCKSILKKLP